MFPSVEHFCLKFATWHVLCQAYFVVQLLLACHKLQVSVGLNNMRYRGKSGYGGNVAAQYAATQGTTVASNIQLNSERAGKMSLRVTSHDRPQLGFSLLLPVVGMILGKIRGRE